MNKTVTINISGIIFNIDEVAYNKLHQYLETIKSYFKNTQGTDEIMTDIEARIAEMFQEKITAKNQVISIKDVDEVIAIMGQPEDYLDVDFEEEKTTQESNYQYTSESKRKKLYRDPDQRVAGGVCSGIGHYFDVDPIIFRAIFVIAFLGFGSGLLLYIILWIIMPEARTTAEKLEMKGESVTIDNIKKKVEEEAENLKKRFNDFKDQSGPTAKRSADKLVAFLQSIFNFIFSIVGFLLKFFAKFFGIILLIFGSIALLVFVLSLFGTSRIVTLATSNGNFSYPLSDLTQVFFSSGIDSFFGVLGIVLIALVPLGLLVIGGLKILFRHRIQTKGIGIIALALWVIGILSTVYAGTSTLSEFSNLGTFEKVIPLASPKTNLLNIKTNPMGLGNKIKFQGNHRLSSRSTYFSINDDVFSINNPRLKIEPTNDSTFQLVIVSSARGLTTKEAVKRAENINYQFQITDSTLVLNDNLSFNTQDKWRNQKVNLVLLVPYGKSVYLSGSAGKIIYDIPNVSNTWDEDMLNKKWTMLTQGLTCIGCFEGWDGKTEKKED